MTEKKGPGRPAYEVPIGARARVQRMVSCGMTHKEIAAVLGISEPTLALYYVEDLLEGRAKQRAKVLDRLFHYAETGNVSAAKHLETLTRDGAQIAASAEGEAPAVKKAKLGKKEQALLDADTAGKGGTWEGLLDPPNFSVVLGGRK